MLKKNVILVFISFLLISCVSSKSKNNQNASKLDGTWQLNYIIGAQVGFDALYPKIKPTLVFNVNENQVSGNNGCNSFSGSVAITGNSIDLSKPMAVTKKMCIDGQQGETLFMNTLSKITQYSVSDNGNTLTFISGDIARMRFSKQ